MTTPLWLEDERTHARRMVMEATVQTLTLAWSPKSTAFIANDRALSDVENAYIYDVKTPERIDLRRQVLADDGTAASRFTSDVNPAANHSYFHALRWLDARHVEMHLYGHTDGAPNGKPFRPGHEEDSVRSVTASICAIASAEMVSCRKDCPEASPNVLGPVSTSTPMPDVCHAFNGGVGRGLHARAANMADLVSFVENWTDRPLLDKTGIRGLYRIETGPYLRMDAMADRWDVPDAPTVFEMFGQLVLSMEPQRGVVEIYVIDHIEKPSEN
jgi:Protein of unknown function (DUF3738)